MVSRDIGVDLNFENLMLLLHSMYAYFACFETSIQFKEKSPNLF